MAASYDGHLVVVRHSPTFVFWRKVGYQTICHICGRIATYVIRLIQILGYPTFRQIARVGLRPTRHLADVPTAVPAVRQEVDWCEHAGWGLAAAARAWGKNGQALNQW